MEISQQEHNAITNDTSQSQWKESETKSDSPEHNEAALAGDQNNPYFSEYVALDRTTIDSHGRRSMAYLHKPTGKIVPDTERHDADIPDESLRNHRRRHDILLCWALCEDVKPHFLRNIIQYLVLPLYWFSVILSLLIVFWAGFQQHQRLQAEESKKGGPTDDASQTAQVALFEGTSMDDKFSDVVWLGKTALDPYGRRSMACLNRRTGEVVTTTEIIEHDVQDLPMRRYRRRADVAFCWVLCENVKPEMLQTALRAVSLPIFSVFIGINFLLLQRDIRKEKKVT